MHKLMHQLGYTLQANRKSTEGTQHSDRDAQFNYLNEQVRAAQDHGHPVISVHTKKKELIGEFKNGRERRPKGEPEPVKAHDSVIPENGKAIPYGVYDLRRDEGWVSVGIDHDTAHFAVNAIRRWWNRMGRSAYGGSGHLVITADAATSGDDDVADSFVRAAPLIWTTSMDNSAAWASLLCHTESRFADRAGVLGDRAAHPRMVDPDEADLVPALLRGLA